MSKIKFGANPVDIGFNFKVGSSDPVDSRFVVETFNDLINPETWGYALGDVFIYQGLTVYVRDEKALYTFMGGHRTSGIPEEEAIKAENWIRTSDSKGLEDVENRLEDIENTIWLAGINGQDFVDMGDAGVWTKYPIGLTSYDDGLDGVLYFQWGDTQGYVDATDKYFNDKWTDYKFGGSNIIEQSKYNSIDGLSVLEPGDDAAVINLGGNWKMPTKADFDKLVESCDTEWVDDYEDTGVSGVLFTLKTDDEDDEESKQLFFPAAGRCVTGAIKDLGTKCYVWSSSLDGAVSYKATSLNSDSTTTAESSNDKYYGQYVFGFISKENAEDDFEKYATKDELHETEQRLEKEIQDALPYARVTWEELVGLRDVGELIEGRWYRIIDYACTTTQEDTKSANHPFDVIVLATSKSTLSEEGRVVMRDKDTYFNSNNLEAWKIWYCLDNDSDRFAWADVENGKGVVYRMIDEFGNDCPYDFKNILFKRYKVTGMATGYPAECFDELDESSSNLYIGYDDMSGFVIDDEDFEYYYTFAYGENDGSLDGGASQNVISKYKNELNKLVLNNIVFVDHFGGAEKCNVHDNVFIGECHDITISNGCYFNTIESGCYDNIFGPDCYENQILSECHGNIFGTGFVNNKLGFKCEDNIFGSGCVNNILNNACTNNRFGQDCQNNILNNDCRGNVLDESCYNNIFGNYCAYNTFGNYCCNNNLGNNCQYNIFGYCSDNTSSTGGTITKQDYFSNISLGDSVSCINLFGIDKEDLTLDNYITDVNIHKGVHGGKRAKVGAYLNHIVDSTTTRLDIEINAFCQDYEINVSNDKNGVLTFWTT